MHRRQSMLASSLSWDFDFCHPQLSD